MIGKAGNATNPADFLKALTGEEFDGFDEFGSDDDLPFPDDEGFIDDDQNNVGVADFGGDSDIPPAGANKDKVTSPKRRSTGEPTVRVRTPREDSSSLMNSERILQSAPRKARSTGFSEEIPRSTVSFRSLTEGPRTILFSSVSRESVRQRSLRALPTRSLKVLCRRNFRICRSGSSIFLLW